MTRLAASSRDRSEATSNVTMQGTSRDVDPTDEISFQRRTHPSSCPVRALHKPTCPHHAISLAPPIPPRPSVTTSDLVPLENGSSHTVCPSSSSKCTFNLAVSTTVATVPTGKLIPELFPTILLRCKTIN